jgi:hypothetical protein
MPDEQPGELERLKERALAGLATPEELRRLCDLVYERDRRLQAYMAFVRGRPTTETS